MKSELIKGFRDFTGEEAIKREAIREVLVKTFEKYGFEPVETPIIEDRKFVEGDNQNDEAVSDIYRLEDKGKRKLALRYEFTFQLKRLMQNKKLPFKRYQIGPVFRDEPVSENRLRQFTQGDIDVVGISEISARDEAEVISTINQALKEIGIEPIILINSRELIDEILEEQKIKEKDKEQVLREIDKFDKLPESEIKKNLKKYNAEKVLSQIKKGEKYFDKFESYKKIISLIDYCRTYGVEVKFSPTIVRGLSYYDGIVFEVKTKNAKETICGGGAYTFNNIKCFGCSIGLERVSSLSNLKLNKEKYLIVSLEQDRPAIKLAQNLRKKGNRVSMFYGKPSKAMEYANSYKIKKVVFVGEREVKAKKFKVKDMDSGKESVLKV